MRFYSILNKLTLENFDSLSNKIVSLGIPSAHILISMIRMVFDKALSEPKFSQIYADLCVKLAAGCPTFDDSDNPEQKVCGRRDAIFALACVCGCSLLGARPTDFVQASIAQQMPGGV